MGFIQEIESMPTGGKVILGGAVLGVGVIGFLAFRKNTGASTTSTNGAATPTTAPVTNWGADQFVAKSGSSDGASDQSIYNLINSKRISANFSKIESELAAIQAQIHPLPQIKASGPATKPTGGAYFGAVSGAGIRPYHPLQSATIASKRPFRI